MTWIWACFQMEAGEGVYTSEGGRIGARHAGDCPPPLTVREVAGAIAVGPQSKQVRVDDLTVMSDLRAMSGSEVVLGTDGVHSATRGYVDPDAPSPRYTGLVSFGGFGRNPGLPPEPGLWKMMFGRRAFFGWFVPDTAQAWWFISVPMNKPLSREEILVRALPRGCRGSPACSPATTSRSSRSCAPRPAS